MRRTIARRLVQSKQTIPHFYVRKTIDAAALVAFQIDRKASYACSLNDVIVKAVALAVSEFPAFRSRIENDTLLEFPDANIGLAVGVDDGVIVAPIAPSAISGCLAPTSSARSSIRRNRPSSRSAPFARPRW
jgi:pyruvate dehydrogenase E2 component (dihydrolipoamide acetyltransferase)